MRERTLWQRLVYALGDRSLIIGAAIVGALVIIMILGPELAPHNPFHVDRIQTINGQIGRAPFPPSSTYWLGTDDQGRDTLSLLLYGARQTLTMAVLATVARILLGLLLGAIAGWWHARAVDRAVMSLVEFLAPFPTLILAIALILAMGIQRGGISFIIALCLVGWGEVAQVVRSHVLVIRHKLYVEAARALGLSEPEILSRHVLPNLLPTLLSLAALEMGGVLLLLGELGFLNIFIGGGTTYIEEARGVIHFFDVPDWGAMLGTSWRYFSAAPWLPLAPATAFFLSILGFNLFGFGFQRFIERGRFHPSGWSLLRLALVIGVVLFVSRTIMRSTGLEAHYTKMAQEFNTSRALADIAFLADPGLEGRPTGPGGGHEAAGYIAAQFRALNLTPILPTDSYFQIYDWCPAQRALLPPGQLGQIAECVTGAVNVIGHIPGTDVRSTGDRILVAASYTGPPPSPDGTIYPGADENASGVAVMLEIARLWREQGFEPKKTVVFAALDARGDEYLLNHPIFPRQPSDTWLVIEIEGVGAGEQRLSSESLGGLGLPRILEESASRIGVKVNYLGEGRFFFGADPDRHVLADPAYSGLRITRLGDELSGGPLDTLDHLDSELLDEAGRVLDHLLMVLSTQW